MRKIFLSLLVLLLAGCALPEGTYTIPEGYHADIYNEQGTQIYQFCSGWCPPTPDTSPTTPDTSPTKVCLLNVQGFPHNVRSYHDSSATILGNLGIGSNAVGEAFHYPTDLTEWAYITGINYLTGNEITGWIQVNDNILYDPQGPCLDVPATYEVTPVPTYTPAPTFTPVPTVTPNPNTCKLIAPATNYINVRLLPSTTERVLGQFANGAETLAISQYRSGYTWYKVWWFGSYGWVAGVPSLTTQGNCDALPVESPFEVPGTVPMVGFKTVPGASASVLIEFARRLPDTVQAVAFTVQDTELATQLHNAGIYTVFVPWSAFPGDCANTSMSPYNSAVNRMEYVERQVGTAAFDAVVLTNECAWPSAAYYAEWSLAVMDLCDARGWICIPHVWNTGTPDLDWLPELDAMYCEMEKRGHGYGTNIYPYWPVPLMSDDQRTVYTTWRHKMIQQRMECSPTWYVTELASNGGGWEPDIYDTAEYINNTIGEFGAVGVWYVGQPLGAWPDAVWNTQQVWMLAELVK